MPNGTASMSYGTVPAGRQKEMTGLEFVHGLVDGLLPLNAIAPDFGLGHQKGRERTCYDYCQTGRTSTRLAPSMALLGHVVRRLHRTGHPVDS